MGGHFYCLDAEAGFNLLPRERLLVGSLAIPGFPALGHKVRYTHEYCAAKAF
jgi:hypothetical protein